MPLPAANTDWPPTELQNITPALSAWDAWWVGDVDALEATYISGSRVRVGQLSGGVVGAVSRFFWGRPNADATQPRRKLHIPIATDLCQASSDLLWSEAPTITVEDEATQERLDELVDDGALQVLAEGAEVGAALGGHFLRVTWDDKVAPDGPFITTVHADAALPVFRWGRLVAVTFWSVLKRADGEVWRHLEHHSLDAAGVGIIEHALFRGRGDNLGNVVPLTDLQATAGLVTDERPDGTVTTASPGLAVVYVPNQRPQRRFRKDPLGQHLGRSDLDGVEGLMDALDEVYTSWMRDIRLAKARIMVAQSMLQDNGPGQGVGFDLDQEVFSPLNVLPPRDASGLPIEAQQFEIRHEEHRATAMALIEQILRTSGYSPATFGIGSEGVAVTATEVKARQQRSFLTRDRKLRAVRPALSELLEKLLAVDAAIFGSRVQVERPSVEFPDGVQESLLSLAQTAQALSNAEAASTAVRVQMLHPEWDEQQVADEVALIRAESGLPPLLDPTDPEVGASGKLAPEQLAQMIQKIYLGVGTVLSDDEARGILNDAGANLTGPGPVGDSPAGAPAPVG